MRAKLTPALIAKLPVPAAGRTIYWDAAMPGVGLMVTKSGHERFVVDYRRFRLGGGPQAPHALEIRWPLDEDNEDRMTAIKRVFEGQTALENKVTDPSSKLSARGTAWTT